MKIIEDRLKELEVTDEVRDIVLSILAAPDDAQVLFRLQEPEIHPPTEGMNRVMFLDTETTGVNTAEDECIELGYTIVEFDTKGNLGNVIKSYDELNKPVLPITNSSVHGITDEMVEGKYINWDDVTADVKDVNLCVAHNSGFDRRIVERYCEEFKEVPWACTYKDVNWAAHGLSSHKLEFVSYMCGFFYDAHRALVDVYATLEVVKRKGLFIDLVKAAMKSQFILKAMGSPFSKKDALKDRGYKPLYVAGKFVCWYTTVDQDRIEDEKAWLLKDAGCRMVPVQEVNSLNRYSIREEIG